METETCTNGEDISISTANENIQRGKEKPKSDMKMSDLQIIPCVICGGKSSGFHYGAISCESCKVFFRRSLKRSTPYVCELDNACVIRSGRRTNCSACRLEKCIQLGMSENGVKIGRYSLERKRCYQTMAEGIEEEARLKQEQKIKEDSERNDEMDKTAARLLDLHKKYIFVSKESYAYHHKKQVEKLEYQKTLANVAGQVQDMSSQDIRDFYKTTGVDLSGYTSAITNCSDCNTSYVMVYANYVKELPEYMELPLHDRIILFKASWGEWFLVSGTQAVNIRDHMLSCLYCGFVLTKEEFRFVGPPEDFEQHFLPHKIIQQLNLEEQETAVLRAFVLFETSRTTDELLNRDQVNATQEKLLNCLLYVLEKHRGPQLAARAFASITHALTETRSLQSYMANKQKELEPLMLGEIKCSKLVAELFDIPDNFVTELENEFLDIKIN